MAQEGMLRKQRQPTPPKGEGAAGVGARQHRDLPLCADGEHPTVGEQEPLVCGEVAGPTRT
eukprot:2135137-Alexandrium_andersonii.AAC.1